MTRILAINPGSTTTKIGVFEDERELYSITLDHDLRELAACGRILDQFNYRRDAILAALNEKGFAPGAFDGVVGRGGMLGPLKAGAYRINEAMKDVLVRASKEHASNLGAFLASDIAALSGAPAWIYDGVSVDEMWPFARVTGIPGIERPSIGHALNMRAVAREWAAGQGRSYEAVRVIVAHLGGGITLSLHLEGRMVDMISDDEGPFSPERAGAVPCRMLIKRIYGEALDEKQARDALQGKAAGLWGLIGTADTREVERRIDAGDREAAFYYEAMAFQVAKYIGQLAVEAEGRVDQILLTGGTAHSERFTGWIGNRVGFLAPVSVLAGERELKALALGALRVLRGEERAMEYAHQPRSPLMTP